MRPGVAMEMTRLEKWLVNRDKKAERNIARVRQRLATLPVKAMEDVLELGCGIGAVAAFLSETYSLNVCGSDCDHKQIQIARKRHPENDRLIFRVEDATRLSFHDGSFDLVVSQNVFHHLKNWQSGVREIARVLRPGGFLLWLDLTVPEWIAHFLQPLVKNHSLYCIAEVKSVFKHQGLEQRFHERRFHGPFSQHHMIWKKGEASR
jgi:ubiquinone/menaquinone biosynthesis C-methylase UbiE